MRKNIVNFFRFTVFIAFASCFPSVTEKSDINQIESDSLMIKALISDSTEVDSSQVDNVVLKGMYVKAIQEYIHAIYHKDKTSFDTLYLANRKMSGPDDFPDIELPKKIGGVEIILLSFGEAHIDKIKQYKETTPMINLMGWVDKVKAEFIFITFFPEFNHKYDCYINYNFNSTRKEYDLEKLTIEVLMNDKDGKPDHYSIYQDGKHTGDKPIK